MHQATSQMIVGGDHQGVPDGAIIDQFGETFERCRTDFDLLRSVGRQCAILTAVEREIGPAAVVEKRWIGFNATELHHFSGTIPGLFFEFARSCPCRFFTWINQPARDLNSHLIGAVPILADEQQSALAGERDNVDPVIRRQSYELVFQARCR